MLKEIENNEGEGVCCAGYGALELMRWFLTGRF